MPNQIPPPPPGFELVPMDGASTGSNIPPPPPGFELISDAPAKMSLGEDVARSAGAGLRRGVIEGLTGMAGDTAAMSGDVAAWLASKLGASEDTTETVRNVGRYASPFFGMPTTGEVEQQITDPLMGDALKHDPQTMAGEYAKTGAEFLPAALGNRGSLVRRGAQVVIPAFTSETAGQVAEQVAPEFEPAARALGAIAGGGGVELTRGRGASGAISAATEGATPAQLAEAERLFRQAQLQGTPITRFEAVQHATGGGTRAGDMQRVIEGQGGLRDFMAARPAQNEAAARRAFDTITPPTNAPSTIGPQVGAEAEGIVTDVRQGINRATEPMYRAAEQIPPQTGVGPNAPRRIDAQTFQQVQNAPGWNEARNAIRNDPQLARYVQGMPDDSIAFLNEVQKYLAQQGENAAGAMNAQRNQQRAAGYGQDATAVRTAAEQASPDFAQAVQTQARLREQYLDPLLQGPIGKIAARDTATQDAINALFPRNPLPNSTQEIARTVGVLANRNPLAARGLVRAHLESTFNEATRELQSGANQFGGAGFAAKIRGNPQQAANLEAAVRALGARGGQYSGDEVWEGFNRFLEMVEAQGQRQRIGSQTAFNQEALKNLQAGSPLGSTTAVAAGGGFQWPRKAMEVFERWRLGRNVDEIARLITDPGGARIFGQIARAENGRGVVDHSIRLLFLARQGANGSSGQ